MQVWAAINEADITSIHVGQATIFTVDGLPENEFHGVVGKIRMNANMTQNVVTYTVEVNADNSELLLRAYQTANMKFEVDKRANVMTVPNAALRWAPTALEQISEETRVSLTAANEKSAKGDKPESDKAAGGSPNNPTTGPSTGPSMEPASRPSRGRKKPGGKQSAAKTVGTICVQDGKFAKPIKVKLGITDGANTEVQATELAEGMVVIIGETKAADTSTAEGRNPLLPQFGRGGGGGGGRRGQ